jgi:EAL domain-containing protein (putative c-di-GMP-specific phosphodiesterase class I)
VANRELFVSPSIGVAVAPADGTDVEVLLTNADAAMYRAKASGRNTFSFYTPDLNAQAHKRLARESNLHTALERGELVLHYQPKVDLTTGVLVGMEALARWNHRDEGLIPPDEFIPLAEETGLIVALGEWALETACTQTRAWRADGLDLKVAVNLSARQFEHQQMADVVARILRRTGLEPAALELELTESVALADPAAITSTLQQFRDLGVSCSIDDFGTGYNGLSYLSRLPIDTLKIDKSFIDQIARGEDESRIVAAIIALAHGLRMTVIAEGVETSEQLDFLHANGCDELQGFLFSRPLPAAEFRQLLNNPVPLSFARTPPLRHPVPRKRAVVLERVRAGGPGVAAV